MGAGRYCGGDEAKHGSLNQRIWMAMVVVVAVAFEITSNEKEY